MRRTRDINFIPTANCIEEDEKGAYLEGVVRRQEIDLVFRDPSSSILIGRSGQTQLGENLVPRGWESLTISKSGKFEAPARLYAHGVLKEALLRSHLDLYKDGVSVRAGRLVSTEGVERLDETALRNAFGDLDIMCGGREGKDYRINSDGSLSVKLDPGQFIHNDKALKLDDILRKNAILHGRDGISAVQDFREQGDRAIDPQDMFIGGVRLSTGKYCALIRVDVSDQVEHLAGGRFLDSFRSTRIDQRYAGSGLRQVELLNNSRSAVEPDSLWVTFDLYTDFHQADKLVSKHFVTETQKKFMHLHGPSMIQATGLDNPERRALLFRNVTPTTNDDLLYGRVVTRNGVTPIEWADTQKFQNHDTKRAVQNRQADRSQDERYADFIEGLGETKDQGRVLICHNLPTADQLVVLSDAGVKSFIFKGIRSRSEDFESGNDPLKHNVYLNDHLYQTIKKLERGGNSFVFCFEEKTENGETKDHLMEFYKGFWCRPEAKERLDKVEVVIDMYGWHKDNFAEKSEEDIRGFFQGLIEIFGGPEKIAVAHGKGPGYMYVAHKIARELGIFSIGIGIDVEKKDQKPNFEPDAVLDFDSQNRLARQTLLDQVGTFYIFNPGGYGTTEESSITLCSHKLTEYMPGPLLYIDPFSSVQVGELSTLDEKNIKHMWQFLYNHSDVLSLANKVQYGEESYDISQTPLGPDWVSRNMVLVKSYKDALVELKKFVEDPIAFWKSIGFIKSEDKPGRPGSRYDDARFAWEKQLALSKETERPIPNFYYEAMEKIEAHYDQLRTEAQEASNEE